MVCCRICNQEMRVITNSHLKKHKLNVSKYRELYPNEELGYSACHVKKIETWMQNYGVEHPVKIPAIRKKMRNTLIEKYGEDNPLKIEKFLEKMKKTNMKKYGTEFPIQNSDIKKKMKETNMDKYQSEIFSTSLKAKEDWLLKHPFLTKVEEIVIKDNTFLVHCKNHDCENSKEKGGWFVPTGVQLYERVRSLESEMGSDGSFFYCSKKCKELCPLYNQKGDPYKKIDGLYNTEEYQTFRKFVLERDKYKCQYCGEPATDVHHERPQKLEPFFALDPDFAWSCCKKCHYEKGHPTKTECSTGNLSNKICI